jgi:plastocyanin
MNIFKALIIITSLLFTIPAHPQTTHIVQASDFIFTPADLTIQKGDTVKWVWVNGMHTTTSDSTTGSTVWNAPLDQSHTSFSYVFNNTGVFPYYCAFHVSFGMKGIITVEPATDVSNENSAPYSFDLEQNYPNPFNPTTTIQYSIAKQSYVTLIVYNILGRVVATLVNGEKPAGNYEVEFNPQQNTNNKQLSSGIYFYQIRAGAYNAVKKMILLR